MSTSIQVNDAVDSEGMWNQFSLKKKEKSVHSFQLVVSFQFLLYHLLNNRLDIFSYIDNQQIQAKP